MSVLCDGNRKCLRSVCYQQDPEEIQRLCVCLAGERQFLLSSETDAEYQLFFPLKSLFYHELEHQLESSLLCDCCLLSWNNFFFFEELGSFSKQKDRAAFVLIITSPVHRSNEYGLLFLLRVRCEQLWG